MNALHRQNPLQKIVDRYKVLRYSFDFYVKKEYASLQWGERTVPNSIIEIKKKLNERTDEHVLIEAQAGHEHITTHHGILSRTYPVIFVIYSSDEQRILD